MMSDNVINDISLKKNPYVTNSNEIFFYYKIL